MALKLVSVKCPDCGQSISVEENRTAAFCSYCGAKVLISNENEYIVRHVDEAGVQQAETERRVKLKELEIKEKHEAQSSSLRKTLTVAWLVITIILLAIIIIKTAGSESGLLDGFLMLLFIVVPVTGGGAFLVFKFLPEKENERIIQKEGGIRFPKNLEPFDEKKYRPVEDTLRSAGFTNISCVNLHDLNILTALVNNEKIDNITVNGQPVRSGGKIYMPDVSIVITFHGR